MVDCVTYHPDIKQFDSKQDTLVSGTNIKTVNGGSIVGSGDLVVSSSVSWGGISGTLSGQTDLQTALDGKSSTSHNHDASYAAASHNHDSAYATAGHNHTGVYASASHTHPQSDITNLTTDLAAKQATLVSGTNIKTVNGSGLLGSGDVVPAGLYAGSFVFPDANRPTVLIGGHGVTTVAAGNMVANRLYIVPVFVHRSTTITKIQARVTTGVASTAVRIGIYADSGNKPGTLVVDGGTASTVTSSTDAQVTVNVTIGPGLYWMAAVFNGAPGMTCIATTAGTYGKSSAAANFTGLYRSFTYGTLPSNETASTWTTLTGSTCPCIMMG